MGRDIPSQLSIIRLIGSLAERRGMDMWTMQDGNHVNEATETGPAARSVQSLGKDSHMSFCWQSTTGPSDQRRAEHRTLRSAAIHHSDTGSAIDRSWFISCALTLEILT